MGSGGFLHFVRDFVSGSAGGLAAGLLAIMYRGRRLPHRVPEIHRMLPSPHGSCSPVIRIPAEPSGPRWKLSENMRWLKTATTVRANQRFALERSGEDRRQDRWRYWIARNTLRPGPGMAHTGREMKSPAVFAALASLAAGLSFAQNPKFKPAKLLDYAQSAETTRAYFCFEAASPDRLLIGYSPPRKGWDSFVGKTLPVSYDDREIHVRRPGGRTLRLTQDYLTRAFATASPCGQLVEHAREMLNAPPKKLRTRSVTQSTPQ